MNKLAFLFLALLFGTFLFAQDIKVTVYPDTLHRIDHQIFGHFLERPSWGGEWGIEHAMSSETGWLREPVLEKLKGLDIPVLRFPGGTDVDYMNWTDMIDLPGRENRPVSTGNQGDKVTNRFGYDEFGKLIRELDCEAIVPLNFFDAFLKREPLDTAALHHVGLVAYCNADTGQTLPAGMRDWAAIRVSNGHPRPFKFKYFQIGNETWALWQWKKALLDRANIENPHEWYVECVRRYVELIEAIDPEIKIIADYIDSKMQTMLLDALGDRIDYYVFHKYMPWAMKPNNIKKDGQTIPTDQLTEEEVWNAFVSTPNKFDGRGMSSIGSPLIALAEQHDFKIAVTEWNWNGWWDSVSPKPLSSLYAQSVGVAGFLHGLVRNGHVIDLACQSMLVGRTWGITGIRVHHTGNHDPYYLPTSQMTSFYAENHGAYRLRSDIQNMPTFKQPLQLASIRPKSKVAYVDVLTTGSENSVSVFFINRDFSEDRTITLDLAAFSDLGASAQHIIITGELHNSKVNPYKEPYISGNDHQIEIENQSCIIALPARSVSVLHVPGTATRVKDGKAALPNSFELKQNYPNPFNPSTTIKYHLDQSGMTRLDIFDLLGRRVVTVLNEQQSAGTHQVNWAGANDHGVDVGNGMYVARLRHAHAEQSIKLIKLN